jgi:alkanesulfonate monooxygenase SsuD/methylene tetrahydromethanopterin reductase-like flavin-dependent oxidoreductase (luciferase family)
LGRPTRAETDEFLHYYASEHADWDAVDNLMALQGHHAQSFTRRCSRPSVAVSRPGHGSCPLVGTPDDVADEIERFHRAGFGGTTLSFVDYVSELAYFAQEVLPRLEAKGIRVPG